MDNREHTLAKEYTGFLRSLSKTAIDLPTDLIKYCHQIDGHGILGNKPALLFYKPNGTVYKPVQKFPKGLHEVSLYQQVFDSKCTDEVILELRNFLPHYVGLYRDVKTQRLFLGMKDVLAIFEQPAVCDIKLGRLTYAPDAKPEKVEIEKQKHRWQDELGFSINAMKLVDPSNDTIIHLDRSYCRSLTPDNIYVNGIRAFLCGTPSAGALRYSESACCRATAFLSHLVQLTDWFERQHQFAFYASSLLLAYDACGSQSCDLANSISQPATSASIRTTVNLIDFTRWRRQSVPGQPDANIIYGLRRLIALFRQVESYQP